MGEKHWSGKSVREERGEHEERHGEKHGWGSMGGGMRSAWRGEGMGESMRGEHGESHEGEDTQYERGA